MKKLVAFALILGLGMFCATGCTPAKKTDKKDDKAGAAAKDTGAAKDAGAKDAPKDEKAK